MLGPIHLSKNKTIRNTLGPIRLSKNKTIRNTIGPIRLSKNKTIRNTLGLIHLSKNKRIRNTIGLIHLSKNKRIVTKQLTIGGTKQCLSQVGYICCKQTKSTNKFHIEYTKKTYKILHNLNCHSKFLNYLGYCILCPKNTICW